MKETQNRLGLGPGCGLSREVGSKAIDEAVYAIEFGVPTGEFAVERIEFCRVYSLHIRKPNRVQIWSTV